MWPGPCSPKTSRQGFLQSALYSCFAHWWNHAVFIILVSIQAWISLLLYFHKIFLNFSSYRRSKNILSIKCRVFLQRQIWIVNYYIKNPSKILSNFQNPDVSAVFKTKCELKFQNKLFFRKHQFLCFHYWEFLSGFWCNNWCLTL